MIPLCGFVSETMAFRPWLWFGVYERVEWIAARDLPGYADAGFGPLEWSSSIAESRYREALGRIREHLRVGDCYQVNFTFRLRIAFPGDPWDFFRSVCRDRPPAHAAYVALPEWAVCSFSPERFFALDGEEIVSEPMKGTRPRRLTLEQDLTLAGELRRSPKDRAENVMITDMVRNDLGRIAETGSVVVDDLCRVKKHATVLADGFHGPGADKTLVDGDVRGPFSSGLHHRRAQGRQHGRHRGFGIRPARPIYRLRRIRGAAGCAFSLRRQAWNPGRVQLGHPHGVCGPASKPGRIRSRRRNRLGFQRQGRVCGVPDQGRGAASTDAGVPASGNHALDPGTRVRAPGTASGPAGRFGRVL